MSKASSARKRVLLAAPRGFCAGVVRAIQAVEKALEIYGAPVYVRHEIVHNKHVVKTLQDKGAVFVDDTSQVPEGSVVLFSAHGVAPEVHRQAAERNLQTIDATCPLVTKVHKEAVRYAREGYGILLIGHEGHEEVIGTLGEAPDDITLVDGPQDVGHVEVRDESKVVWLSQTTLSVDETMETVDALKAKFPQLISPPSDDICYATQNRQSVVKQMAAAADLVLVVGSANSSNSQRLVDAAQQAGVGVAYLVDCAEEIDEAWLEGAIVVGVTSGASAPEALVEQVLQWLAQRGYEDVETVMTVEERQHFALPRELRHSGAATMTHSLSPQIHPSVHHRTSRRDLGQYAERAWDFLCAETDSTGMPSAVLSQDADFRRTFTGAEARSRVQQCAGVDLGFDLCDEAFSAMLALAHLPHPIPERARHLPALLARQIESGRWHDRYRFFPKVRQFAADTDCTAVATAALYERHLLPRTRLQRTAADLQRAQAPARPHDQALRPLAVMVYWDDGAEPLAPLRGRKQDAVVCCNVLYTLLLADLDTIAETDAVVRATLDLVEEHITSGRYLHGTRYYPSPFAFLHTASRLCRSSAACADRLRAPLQQACHTAGTPHSPLDLALLTLAMDNLGEAAHQRQRRGKLIGTQRTDGSWPAQPYYRLGRVPIYFGSTHLTTLFALRALQPSS